MTLTQERKQEIMSKYQLHATDTGSADLQVAMLTEKINRLSEHLKTNKSDHASRRGLLQMIGQRKRLLAFISKESVQRYQNLADSLGIRRVKD
jgi:small subunit ribosomal protein S15